MSNSQIEFKLKQKRDDSIFAEHFHRLTPFSFLLLLSSALVEKQRISPMNFIQRERIGMTQRKKPISNQNQSSTLLALSLRENFFHRRLLFLSENFHPFTILCLQKKFHRKSNSTLHYFLLGPILLSQIFRIIRWITLPLTLKIDRLLFVKDENDFEFFHLSLEITRRNLSTNTLNIFGFWLRRYQSIVLFDEQEVSLHHWIWQLNFQNIRNS